MNQVIAPTQKLNATVAVSRRAVVGSVFRVVGFAALVSLGAQVRIPVPGTDVPMTLQLLAMLLAGFVLNGKEAAASIGLYLLAGSSGLPVFTPGSAGLGGLTGGYLVGFFPAAVLMTVVRGAGVARMIVAGLLGIAVVLGCGVLGRMWALAGDGTLALSTGFWPFWPKALVELGVAVALVRAVRTGWKD